MKKFETIQEELQFRLEFEKLITTISTHFISLDSNKFHTGVLQGLRKIAEFANIDRMIIYVNDHEIQQSIFEWKVESVSSHQHFLKYQFALTFPWLLNQMENNIIINYVDIDKLPDDASMEYTLFKNEGITAILCIPMIYQNNFFGWLEFANFHPPEKWDIYTVDQFKNVANLFLNALERKKYENKIHSLYQDMEQRINDKTTELTTLLNIQKALTTELHIDHVIQLIADGARKLTSTCISTVYLLENGNFSLKVFSGDQDILLPLGFEIPYHQTHLEVAFRAGIPILIDKKKNASKIFKKLFDLSDTDSILLMPLISNQEIIGMISVADKEDGELGPDDERLLKMFATIAIIALNNAHIYTQEQNRREEAERGKIIAEALRDILRVLNSKMDLQEILDYIATQSRELLSSSSTMIRRIDYSKSTVITAASSNLPVEFEVIREIPFYPGGSERILKDNKPVVVSNLKNSLGRYLDDPEDLATPQRDWARAIIKYYHSHFIIPLIINDELYGTLTFYYNQPTEFSEEDIKLGMILGTQVSLAIENARLRSQEKEIAVAAERNRLAKDLHDAVTQTLFSATLIADVLPRLWERNQSEAKKRLEELRLLTRGALAEMRTLLLELRPSSIDDASFPELIKQLCEALNGRLRIPVELQISGNPDITSDCKINFYRIAQEAMNNIAKHADATEVIVKYWGDENSIHMIIQDNGKGLDGTAAPSNHLGFNIMKERASSINAELVITSEIGNGTKINLIAKKHQ
jgi:signal transduction histidine kinase